MMKVLTEFLRLQALTKAMIPEDLDQVDEDRWDQTCDVCHKKGGAVMSCHHDCG